MKKFFGFLLLFTLSVFHIQAQQDSCHLQISLLTCAPGEELYSTFGHSALRVQDRASGVDIIFNYGTFQFGPDFYKKFVRGKLLYFVSIEEFSSFRQQYQFESRSMQEQVLQLSCTDKQQLFAALKTNATEENKYYRYDFLFDNCSTRLRDIVKANTTGNITFANILPAKIPTFRNLLYTYLDNGAQHWSKFGIDLLLGSRLDIKVTNEQAMFLPDYLLKGFANATIGNKPLASPPETILQMPLPLRGSSLLQPMVVISALLLLVIILSFMPSKKLQRALAVFDFLLFLILGLTGCLLIFMWTATDHALCKDNYNLLWALPTHAAAAFFLWSKGKFISYYLLANIIVQAFLLVGWIFLPQEFNLAFLPVVLLVLLRSWLIILKPFHHGNGERAAV
ncbi:MAG: DUF4105 domain-containing protein [Chitinophagaceae bacterium]